VQSFTSEQWKLLPMGKTINHSKTTTYAIKEQITLIYFAAKQRYGSPRITLELQYLGYKFHELHLQNI
jgi:hypothetical protein